MRAIALLPLVLVAACQEYGILKDADIPELSLRIDSPSYGEFAGEGAIHVRGQVLPPNALLRIEGYAVTPQPDGTFDIPVPFFKPYRILDVTADAYEQHAEARIPVFRGYDPLQTWPGAVTLRVTPTGLDGLEPLLETTVRDLVTQGLGAQLPAFQVAGFTLAVDGIDLGRFDVDLATADDAVVANFLARDAVLSASISGDLFGNPFRVPATITFPKLGVGTDLSVDVDDAGQLVAGFADPKLKIDVPAFAIGAADFGWLADILNAVVDLQGILQGVLTQALGQGMQIPLAGPIAFDTNLLGTDLAIQLTDASTDRLGVGLGLGVGIDTPVPAGAKDVPLPEGDFDPAVDLAVGVHDGLLQFLLKSDLLSLLEQDLVLPGFLGGIFEPLVSNLPGGEQIPEHNGWCLSLKPGDARVARFGTTARDPFAGIYLPDAHVSFSYVSSVDGSCTPWLDTSLAIEVLLDVTEGTKIGLDLAVPEGVVLAYGAEGVDEDEVIRDLGGVLSNLLGLLGGFTSFDLKDLVGGVAGQAGVGDLLSGLSLRDQKAMRDASGREIEGMAEIGIQLFGTSANP